MTLRATLAQLPADYEVTLRPKGGTVDYIGTAAAWLEDDGKIHRLEDFELVGEIYLPGQNGYPIPGHLRAYRKGDIGGHIDPPADLVIRGPIGEWLKLIEPETEASLASLGAGLIAGLGAYMGREVRLKVGRITHTPNIFVVQVGPTGTARKGTADGEIRAFLSHLDYGAWAINHIASGFGSGEALIERVADPVLNSKDEIIAGTEDQRLFIQEGEFSKVLRISDRQGSILADVIRLAFDANRPLANAAKTSRKLISTNHCIAMFGGITPEELVRLFPMLAAMSGTGNRYLWVWSDPHKLLPFGGKEFDVSTIAAEVERNIEASKGVLKFSTDGRAWWEEHYPTLRQADQVPDSVRPVLTRISDQTQRIALVYAATEGSREVTSEHLEAGYAWVEHSIQTVQAVLGGLVRNEDAGRILAALRSHPGLPARKSELHDLFSRNATATTIDAAISELEEAGLVYSWVADSGGGRPPIMVIATTPERGGAETYFVRNAKNGVSGGSKSSFVEDSENDPKSQLVTGEINYEKRGFEELPPESSTRTTKEESPDDPSDLDDYEPDPDDLPDPW